MSEETDRDEIIVASVLYNSKTIRRVACYDHGFYFFHIQRKKNKKLSCDIQVFKYNTFFLIS